MGPFTSLLFIISTNQYGYSLIRIYLINKSVIVSSVSVFLRIHIADLAKLGRMAFSFLCALTVLIRETPFLPYLDQLVDDLISVSLLGRHFFLSVTL